MRKTRILKSAILFMAVLVVSNQVVGAITETERQALIALYNSTNGDHWTHKDNWLGPPGTENTWYGVRCVNDEVIFIGLENNNLVGQIPPELGNLSNLQGLNLHNNKLSGSIPPELANLSACIVVDLSFNRLSGSIPHELGNNPGRPLIDLVLNNNQLSGSIPPELGRLLLGRLVLRNNRLSGTIPPELGNMRNLRQVDLRINELSGSIPPELGKLTKLTALALSNNKLSGSIPPEIMNLKSLIDANSDFRYNSLYTNNPAIRNFLESKQHGGNWEATQTVAPTDVTAYCPPGDSIQVSWTPIHFQEFGGCYRVYCSTISGGPYRLFGETDNKKTSFLSGAALNPDSTYYFVVQTVTIPHEYNTNTVTSAFSQEAIGSQDEPKKIVVTPDIKPEPVVEKREDEKEITPAVKTVEAVKDEEVREKPIEIQKDEEKLKKIIEAMKDKEARAMFSGVPEGFVYVEGGTFEMGSDEGNPDETPVHPVTVNDFLISKHEVTFDEFDAFCEDTGRKRPKVTWRSRGNRAVIFVDWFDAVEYCNWRSLKDTLTPCYTMNRKNVTCDFSADGYRLPTETEWEYAARGGKESKRYKYAGSNDPQNVAWCRYKSTYSELGVHPVGELYPNELGLYDMSGNAYEWCWDWYDTEYYQTSPNNDPCGPASGKKRVQRGGAWTDIYESLRTTQRFGCNPTYKYHGGGFRIVRNK